MLLFLGHNLPQRLPKVYVNDQLQPLINDEDNLHTIFAVVMVVVVIACLAEMVVECDSVAELVSTLEMRLQVLH